MKAHVRVLLFQRHSVALNCKDLGVLLEECFQSLRFGNTLWLLHTPQLGQLCLSAALYQICFQCRLPLRCHWSPQGCTCAGQQVAPVSKRLIETGVRSAHGQALISCTNNCRHCCRVQSPVECCVWPAAYDAQHSAAQRSAAVNGYAATA